MSKAIKPANLADVIQQELTLYTEGVTERVNQGQRPGRDWQLPEEHRRQRSGRRARNEEVCLARKGPGL